MMFMAHAAGASVPSPAAQTGPTASANAVTALALEAQPNVRLGHVAVLRGEVTPGGARDIAIEIGGDTVNARSGADGAFTARWKPSHAGEYVAHAGLGGDTGAGPSDTAKVNVYRPASASYYGPGLYGGALACGGTLSPGKVGVANKTLPCGTHLTLRYRHRTVRVQVIDRGPYSGNREFDLTAATRAKLGFPSTGTVLTTR
jgi:peptidoglycan lytic transglycosylase